MKKLISIIMILCVLVAATAIAKTENPYAQIPDEVLIIVYEQVLAEMQNRGLIVPEMESMTILRTPIEPIMLHEGQYVIGEDIPAGTYLVTCTEVDDWYQNYMSAMGGLTSLLDPEEGAAYGSLFNMLGSVAGDPTVSIRIVGSFGNTVKSYSLKLEEKITITLNEGTAVEISEGSCSLEMKE